jgi:hypothetical protein
MDILRLLAILCFFSPLAASVAEDVGANGTGAKGTASRASGTAILGPHLMHYSAHSDGTGSARFTPPLAPADFDIIFSGMGALTRAVYGEHPLQRSDVSAFAPFIGKVTELRDDRFAYRFLPDGSIGEGISVILVQREALPPPARGDSPGRSISKEHSQF